MNYTELVDAAKAYADRNDIEVTTNMATFIIMVEAKINRVLKTRDQSARAYVPTLGGFEYYPLPPDFRGMRNIQINTDVPTSEHSVCTMNYKTPEQMDVQRSLPATGSLYYTVVGNQINIWPVQEPGLTIEILYYQKVPNLNATDSSNWISDEHPDIYMAGMVAEIEGFAKNYEVSKLWYARLTMAIEELDSADEQERWSGNSLQIRADNT